MRFVNNYEYNIYALARNSSILVIHYYRNRLIILSNNIITGDRNTDTIIYIDRKEERVLTMIMLNMRSTVINRCKFQLINSCNANN